jgi:hypothetical protein
MRFAGSNPQIASFMGSGIDTNLVGESAMNARSQEKMTNTFEQGKIAATGLDALGQIKSAAHQGRAIEAQGDAQAAATRASGMSSMIGSIAGGIGDMSFGGALPAASGVNFSSPSFTSAQSAFGSFYNNR